MRRGHALCRGLARARAGLVRLDRTARLAARTPTRLRDQSGREPRTGLCKGCASSTSHACSPVPSRRAFWRASAQRYCASTRRGGTSLRSCPTSRWENAVRASTFGEGRTSRDSKPSSPRRTSSCTATGPVRSTASGCVPVGGGHLRPGLVDVSLCAYGWTGPWRGRRGFDSLVQMSSGIAEAGMRASEADRPVPLPVQALDHACGYLMAAAVLRGLTQRVSRGVGCMARASLARVAVALAATRSDVRGAGLTPPHAEDWADGVEDTAGGPARRLRPPLSIGTVVWRWDRGAGPLGAAAPAWLNH